MSQKASHPAAVWRTAATEPQLPSLVRLRLAAVAGQIAQDSVVARRAALIDLLAEGRPLPRAVIWQRITAQLGQDCWGKRPQEQLIRDIAVLRKGGIRIGYTRQNQLEGYYLKYPALEKSPSVYTEAPTPTILLDAIRQQPIPKKLTTAFAMAGFALQQKRLLLTQQYPTWPAQQIDQQARELVFGTQGLQ